MAVLATDGLSEYFCQARELLDSLLKGKSAAGSKVVKQKTKQNRWLI